MKHTTSLSQGVRAYLDEIAGIDKFYDAELQKIERYKGSAGYDEDVKRIEQGRKSDLREARRLYDSKISKTLNDMRNVLDNRTVAAKPPSEEQLRSLQLLKMRGEISKADIQRTADLCRDNRDAMSLLQEIAHERGIVGLDLRSTDTTLSNEDARHGFDNLRRSCADLFIERENNELPYYLRGLNRMQSESEIVGKLAVIGPLMQDNGGGVQVAVQNDAAISQLSGALNGDG